MGAAPGEPSLPPVSEPGCGSTGSEHISPPEIEGYEILGFLGKGGMGTVWRALERATRRQVALKVMVDDLFGSDRARIRFEREVELAARLAHPNIARVYHSGVHRNLHYYAMELVDGKHLDRYVEEQALSRREIVALMLTVSEAVQYAHQRGVIHRDLKPFNVVVTSDGQPHVLDFGLAKALLEDERRPGLSEEGEIAGTPAYMAPEQAAGQHSRTDTRTDVYALGAILFQLLTGETPHEMSGTRYAVLRRLAEEEVRRPRQVRADINRDLEAILLKALAHDPERRYSMAGELAVDLGNWLHGDAVSAKTPTALGALFRLVRRYPVAVGIGLAILVVTVDLAVIAHVRISEERNGAEARLQAARASVEGYRRALARAWVALAEAMLREGDVKGARETLSQCAEDLRGEKWSRVDGIVAARERGDEAGQTP